MENWVLKVENQSESLGKFKTAEEGIDKALQLVVNEFPTLSDILRDTLDKNTNKKFSSAIIRAFCDFENIRTLDIQTLVNDFCDENDVCGFEGINFSVRYDSPYFYEFNFGELRIETNIWAPDEVISYVIFVRNKEKEIKFLINRTLSDVVNSFLVYKALSERHQSRSEIRSNIMLDQLQYSRGYNIDISEDTISEQIKALRYLGVPIYEKKINDAERRRQESLSAFDRGMINESDKPGFYIDYSKPITSDYSKIKAGLYIMLVYFIFQEHNKLNPLPTQQAIVDAIYEKFGKKIKRQNISNYIEGLRTLDVEIKHDNTGYWL